MTTPSYGGNTDIVSSLKVIASNIGLLAQNLVGVFASLTTANTFTKTQTFDVPPVVNAGAVGSGSFAPEGAIDSQFSAAGIGNGVNTTDDTLFSYNLPANSLDQVGRAVRMRAFGKFAATANNKTVKIFFGSSVVLSTGVVAINGLGWTLELMLIKTAASAQIAGGFCAAGATLVTPLTLTGTETDTGPITIKVTGASPTTGAANDVVANGFVVEFLN